MLIIVSIADLHMVARGCDRVHGGCGRVVVSVCIGTASDSPEKSQEKSHPRFQNRP